MSEAIGNRPLNWVERRAIVLDRAQYECAECGGTATEADHKWPRVAGGTDDFDNLQALCRRCNARKGDALHFAHMTPDRLSALAAIRIEDAAAKAIGGARFAAMADLMSQGCDAREAQAKAAPGVDAIPEFWRRWVADHLTVEVLRLASPTAAEVTA